jgi:hypothetical protein
MDNQLKNHSKTKLCKICNKKLKKFTAQPDWDDRIYHKKCFDTIVSDIAKYNTVAYTKYGHSRRLINGLTHEEAKKQTSFIVTFD